MRFVLNIVYEILNLQVLSVLYLSHRHEARDIVRNAVHASEDDAVIFVGSGCTGAIHKLIHAMDFASDEIKPIVLVGPYEHHSNLLPWREIGATVNTNRLCRIILCVGRIGMANFQFFVFNNILLRVWV